MNAQFFKELRSVRTVLIGGLLAGPVISFTIHSHDALAIGLFVFVSLCVMLGASAFGSEFEGRTMLTLLSQPASRRQIWFEKMRIAAAGIVLCYASMFFGLMLYHQATLVEQGTMDIAVLMLLAAAIAFCSAPYYSLLTRSLNAAVVFTFLIPFGLAGGFFFFCTVGARLSSTLDGPLLQSEFQNHPYWAIGTPATLYCILLYWLGYRAFMKLQVVDSHSTELKLPTAVETAIGSMVTKILPGYTSPLASLVRKEFHVQRVNYLMALVICVLFVAEAIMWQLHPWGGLDVLMMAEWLVFGLGIPILAGTVCMAEERSWGTSTWQITLPVSPLKQWVVKISVAVFTVVVLGILLPALLAEVGRIGGGPILRDMTRFTISEWHLDVFLTFLSFYFACFGVVLLASSTSINSLYSLGFAFGMLVACGIAFGFGNDFIEFLGSSGSLNLSNHPALVSLVNTFAGLFNRSTQEGLTFVPQAIAYFWPPALFIGLLLMNYKNFRSGELNPRRKWLQAIAVFLAIVLPALTLDLVSRFQL